MCMSRGPRRRLEVHIFLTTWWAHTVVSKPNRKGCYEVPGTSLCRDRAAIPWLNRCVSNQKGNMCDVYVDARPLKIRCLCVCVRLCCWTRSGAFRWRAVASDHPTCQIPVPRSLADLQAATQAASAPRARNKPSTRGGSVPFRRSYHTYRRRGIGR